MLGTFKGDQSKIQVCTVEKNMEQTTYDYVDVDLLECILPMRLSDETTHGMMNFIKTVKMGATADQIQKALVSYFRMDRIYHIQIFRSEKVEHVFLFNLNYRNTCTMMCPLKNAKVISLNRIGNCIGNTQFSL